MLFYNYYHRPFKAVTLRGSSKSADVYPGAVPAVLSVILYGGLVSSRRRAESGGNAGEFLAQAGNGKSYTHLYFIFINIQFYLLFRSC